MYVQIKQIFIKMSRTDANAFPSVSPEVWILGLLCPGYIIELGVTAIGLGAEGGAPRRLDIGGRGDVPRPSVAGETPLGGILVFGPIVL